jgi:hypothetical protein
MIITFIDESESEYVKIDGRGTNSPIEKLGDCWNIDVNYWNNNVTYDMKYQMIFNIYNSDGNGNQSQNTFPQGMIYPKHILSSNCQGDLEVLVPNGTNNAYTLEGNIIPTFRPIEGNQTTQDALFNFVISKIEQRFGPGLWTSFANSGQVFHIIVDDSGSMTKNLILTMLQNFESFLTSKGINWQEHLGCTDERWIKWNSNIILQQEESCSCNSCCVETSSGVPCQASVSSPYDDGNRIICTANTAFEGAICNIAGAESLIANPTGVTKISQIYSGSIQDLENINIFSSNYYDDQGVIAFGDLIYPILINSNWSNYISEVGCPWFVWHRVSAMIEVDPQTAGPLNKRKEKYNVYKIDCESKTLIDITGELFLQNEYQYTSTDYCPGCVLGGDTIDATYLATVPAPQNYFSDPYLDCKQIESCSTQVSQCTYPTPSPNQPTIPLFDTSSWASLPEPFKSYLDKAANRWMNYIKFNQGVATAINSIVINWNGIQLNSYSLFNDISSGVIASCGVYDYVDLQTISSGVKFNTVSFDLNINLAYQGYYGECEWVDILTHELGHALGIGIFWDSSLQSMGAVPPANYFLDGNSYINAQDAYNLITGLSRSKTPLEDAGGSGTASAHWEIQYRDSSFIGSGGFNYYGFYNELMIGYYSKGVEFKLSKLSIKTLVDFGYEEIEIGASEGDPTLVSNFIRTMTSLTKLNCQCSTSKLRKLGVVNTITGEFRIT